MLVGPLAVGTYSLNIFTDQSPLISGHFSVIRGTLDTELFLGQERFRVDVNWQGAMGGGSGYAKPLSNESGDFWFLDPGNVELTAKIVTAF